MNRYYKKCFIASGGMHVLLVLILVTCPAFLAPTPKQSEGEPIKFIPSIVLDKDVAGGGHADADRPIVSVPTPAPPAARSTPPPPAVRPTPPAPVVKPPPQQEPPADKIKEPAPQKPNPDSLEVSKSPTKKKPVVNLVAVNKSSVVKKQPKDTSAADNQERQERLERDRQQHLREAFDSTLGSIKSGTGEAAKIVGDKGPGGDGPSYGPYRDCVRSAYERAWVMPEDATSEDATVEVSVTIASDGTVVHKRIVKRSGDPAMDASVQNAIDRVLNIGKPFPEGAKDKERTYRIPFNLKLKRGTA
ncbi:MAG: TonB family protein [Verrucomicrobia bacterium]|nr:TonB family protein [Verrucomicrobiota bacterium]